MSELNYKPLTLAAAHELCEAGTVVTIKIETTVDGPGHFESVLILEGTDYLLSPLLLATESGRISLMDIDGVMFAGGHTPVSYIVPQPVDEYQPLTLDAARELSKSGVKCTIRVDYSPVGRMPDTHNNITLLWLGYYYATDGRETFDMLEHEGSLYVRGSYAPDRVISITSRLCPVSYALPHPGSDYAESGRLATVAALGSPAVDVTPCFKCTPVCDDCFEGYLPLTLYSASELSHSGTKIDLRVDYSPIGGQVADFDNMVITWDDNEPIWARNGSSNVPLSLWGNAFWVDLKQCQSRCPVSYRLSSATVIEFTPDNVGFWSAHVGEDMWGIEDCGGAGFMTTFMLTIESAEPTVEIGEFDTYAAAEGCALLLIEQGIDYERAVSIWGSSTSTPVPDPSSTDEYELFTLAIAQDLHRKKQRYDLRIVYSATNQGSFYTDCLTQCISLNYGGTDQVQFGHVDLFDGGYEIRLEVWSGSVLMHAPGGTVCYRLSSTKHDPVDHKDTARALLARVSEYTGLPTELVQLTVLMSVEPKWEALELANAALQHYGHLFHLVTPEACIDTLQTLFPSACD